MKRITPAQNTDSKPLRRIAVSRLHLPGGRMLCNQVLEFRGQTLLRHYPLVEELPATEWHGGDYYLDPEPNRNHTHNI